MNPSSVSFDADADVLYVELQRGSATRTVSVDDLRLIDYSADGAVIGVEFIGASGGVDLRDLPFRQTIEKAIGDSGLPIRILA